jgi:hypothetical protein
LSEFRKLAQGTSRPEDVLVLREGRVGIEGRQTVAWNIQVDLAGRREN